MAVAEFSINLLDICTKLGTVVSLKLLGSSKFNITSKSCSKPSRRFSGITSIVRLRIWWNICTSRGLIRIPHFEVTKQIDKHAEMDFWGLEGMNDSLMYAEENYRLQVRWISALAKVRCLLSLNFRKRLKTRTVRTIGDTELLCFLPGLP